MKASDKFILYSTLLLISAFLFYYLFKLIIWQYEEYNDRRGYCTAEGKYLSDQEKLRNLKADIIQIRLEQTIKEKNQGWYVDDNKVFASKYDLSDKDKIIELIKKADIKKSFEENFGLVAVATVEEYSNRKECLINNRCLNIDHSRDGLRSLWKEDNSVDIDYLKNLPLTYSVVVGSIGILPLSSLKKIDKNTYSIHRYDIDPRCCDSELINNAFNGSGFWGVTKNDTNKMKSNEVIMMLNIEQLNGDDIVYIYDLYRGYNFNNIKEVMYYGLLLSVASLRSDNYPQVIKFHVNSCGFIDEKKRFSLKVK